MQRKFEEFYPIVNNYCQQAIDINNERYNDHRSVNYSNGEAGEVKKSRNKSSSVSGGHLKEPLSLKADFQIVTSLCESLMVLTWPNSSHFDQTNYHYLNSLCHQLKSNKSKLQFSD